MSGALHKYASGTPYVAFPPGRSGREIAGKIGNLCRDPGKFLIY